MPFGGITINGLTLARFQRNLTYLQLSDEYQMMERALTNIIDQVYKIALPVWEILLLPFSNLGILVSLAGGYWIFYNHRREDRFFPKIEFLVDVNFKVEQENHWIAEAVCSVRNRGYARFVTDKLQFGIRGIEKNSVLEDGDKSIQFQTFFPIELKEGNWLPAKSAAPFVETSTTQFYRHIFTVPKNIEAILLHGTVHYSRKLNGKKVWHTADRLVRVPESFKEVISSQKQEDDLLKLSNEVF